MSDYIERFDLQVGDLTFQARESGPADGRPVILLHGVPQTSACWMAQLHALAGAGYRAIAFTQRGYSPGARFPDVADYTMDKLTGDVLAVAQALGLDRFDVVGHDFGAAVAWALAAQHSDRVRTVAIASVPHPAALREAYRSRTDDAAGQGDGGDQHERSGYMRTIVEQPRGTVEATFLADDGFAFKRALAGLPERSVAEYLEVLGTPEGMQGCLDWYRASALRDSDGQSVSAIGPIGIPTLYVWADQDPALGPAAAYATENHVTGPYRFVVLEGIGHWIPETAADRFNEELLAHLSRHPVLS